MSTNPQMNKSNQNVQCVHASIATMAKNGGKKSPVFQFDRNGIEMEAKKKRCRVLRWIIIIKIITNWANMRTDQSESEVKEEAPKASNICSYRTVNSSKCRFFFFFLSTKNEGKFRSFLSVLFNRIRIEKSILGWLPGDEMCSILWSAKITNAMGEKKNGTLPSKLDMYDMWCALDDFSIEYQVLGIGAWIT